MTTKAPAANSGMLVLIVGPSGVGKDALIAYCRSRLAGVDRVVFPRRVITRPAGDGSEDHDTVSEPEFQRRAEMGGFSLSWRAHGLGYGVPAIEGDLAAGRTVVVNVSRAMIDEARRRFRPLTIVSVVASPAVLAARLRGRGRETDEDILRRLERAASVKVDGPEVVRLDNSGALDTAGEALLKLLLQPVV